MPQSLTPEQKQRATDAIKSVDVTVYTGADDQILRRLTVSASLQDTASKVDAALLLDITFTKVGQDQQIEAPANARPFTELLQALDAAGLADLGLGGGSGDDVAPESPRAPRTTSTSTPLHRRRQGRSSEGPQVRLAPVGLEPSPPPARALRQLSSPDPRHAVSSRLG